MPTKQSQADTGEFVRKKEEARKEARNEDPITGEPGAHPTAVGVGTATGGAVAGAALGAFGGPIGAAVGAVAGGVAGGLAGKAVGEKFDPTVEEAYWRDNFTTRDYVVEGESFDTYRPAYRYGIESYTRHPDSRYEEIEPELAGSWTNRELDWEHASPAVRDAFDRLRARCSSCD